VQRIVSVHGGSVRVEDGQGLKGARFVLELSAYGAVETLRD
jgi:signal transduction histidine kinase